MIYIYIYIFRLKKCDICHYWYFLNKDSSFNHMHAIDVMI